MESRKRGFTIMRTFVTSFIIGGWVSIFGLTGCSAPEKVFIPKTEIVALYMHHVDNYSVAIKTENQINIVRMPWQLARTVKIVTDVPEDSPMWYKCDGTYSDFFGDATGSCEIHIRSVDDINTASWNHGKAGSGTTKRIQ
jgi:hypothetical protein